MNDKIRQAYKDNVSDKGEPTEEYSCGYIAGRAEVIEEVRKYIEANKFDMTGYEDDLVLDAKSALRFLYQLSRGAE